MSPQRAEKIARIFAASLVKHHNFPKTKSPEDDAMIREQLDKIAENMRRKSGVKGGFKTSMLECIKAVPEESKEDGDS